MTKSWITFCVLEWHVEADLSDIPVMKEAWKKQFSNALIEMQRQIEIQISWRPAWQDGELRDWDRWLKFLSYQCSTGIKYQYYLCMPFSKASSKFYPGFACVCLEYTTELNWAFNKHHGAHFISFFSFSRTTRKIDGIIRKDAPVFALSVSYLMMVKYVHNSICVKLSTFLLCKHLGQSHEGN